MQASRKLIVALAFGFAFSGCQTGAGAFTLYRDSSAGSPDDRAMRFHVATFDSADGEAYNRENCQVAQELFQAQPGVKVRFWCEKGAYRK